MKPSCRKGRERCRKYAQNKKLAQQEPADTVPIQLEPSFETPEEMKGESACAYASKSFS